jgi:glycine oxidase
MRVIVVGAGAIGLMAALRLAERGADVTVFDAEPENASPSRSASRAAAGMLGPLSETLVERAGTHPRLLELGLASLALWRARGAMLRLSTLPARGARLRGYPPESIEHLRARAGRLTVTREGGDIVIADEAAIDPREALAALGAALAERGGALRRGRAVVDVSEGMVRFSDGGTERADGVVLATGAWSAGLAPGAAPTPTKGQIVEVESDAIAPGATVRAPNVYAVGRADGRVVIGATMEAGRTDLEAEASVSEDLRARAGAIDPRLAQAKIVRAWAGVRPMSADWAPRIGRAGAAIVARGHSRNGWLLAPITAEIVAAHVFGDDLPDLWAAFAP